MEHCLSTIKVGAYLVSGLLSLACSPTAKPQLVHLPGVLTGDIAARLAGRHVNVALFDGTGVSIPYGLIKFDFRERGSLTFQANKDGELGVVMDKAWLESSPELTILSIPLGQSLLASSLDHSAQPVLGACIRVSIGRAQ